MSRFEYHEPSSVADAIDLAARHGDAARFLAGGTDLLIQMQRGRVAPRHVVSLHRVPGLADIAVGGAAEGEPTIRFRAVGGTAAGEPTIRSALNGRIALGARVTHAAIERHAAFEHRLRSLIEGAQVVGGHQVRNVATVGGNIVNASPAADVVAPLLALDAVVTLVGPAGERTLPLDGFATAPGVTARRPDELLIRVAFDAPAPRSATAFLKAGRRRAMEISVVCVAVCLTLDDALERCVAARIALGAVAPTAVRARAAERALEGQVAGAEVFRHAGALAVEACAPISDVRASAAFRRHLIATLVPRALETARARVHEVAA